MRSSNKLKTSFQGGKSDHGAMHLLNIVGYSNGLFLWFLLSVLGVAETTQTGPSLIAMWADHPN